MTDRDTLDRRIIIVELNVAGGTKRYGNKDDPTAQMAIEYSVSKSTGSSMNEAEIKIANLVKTDRDHLLTTTSPLSRPRTRKTVTVYAGYERTGVTRRFTGDIVSASVSQPPDIWLTLKAKTGYFGRGDILSVSAPAQKPLSEIAADTARNLGVSLDFQAADKQVGNYAYTGSATGQIDKLVTSGQVDAYLDDDRLVVKAMGKGLSGKLRKLGRGTGMIGIPEVTEKGVKVKMLMDPHTTLGSQIEILSDLNPAANGVYTVFQIRESGTNRNTPFYLEVEATRPGLGGYPL